MSFYAATIGEPPASIYKLTPKETGSCTVEIINTDKIVEICNNDIPLKNKLNDIINKQRNNLHQDLLNKLNELPEDAFTHVGEFNKDDIKPSVHITGEKTTAGRLPQLRVLSQGHPNIQVWRDYVGVDTVAIGGRRTRRKRRKSMRRKSHCRHKIKNKRR